ncbi:MAG: carbamate kinase [bacterium]
MNVVTLGGNALLPSKGSGTITEQIEVAIRAMSGVAELIASGEDVVLSHGNGPIVGNIVERNEAARDHISPMPLDVCGADSQGGIGYMLQQVLGNELKRRGIEKTVVSLVTQCVVAGSDPAFANPTKPIGPKYGAEEARKRREEKGWTFAPNADHEWRRVVPSPRPLEIVEWAAIRELVARGLVVIAAGGGGVPVIREWDGRLRGVEAVIDKDLAAAVLARQIHAKRLLILTAVPRVSYDYGRATQREIERLTVAEARRGFAEGQFPPGSMGPKIEACLEFIESGGDEAIITSPENLLAAVGGRAGTRVLAAPVATS